MKTHCSCLYDYIIVGSGPAGCAIAQTLLKDKNKILMLEAGVDKDSDELIHNSTFALSLEEDYYPNYFWIVQQQVQENANIPTANYSNGRLFGGGTSINGEQYVRGSSNVFDIWYDITDDEDWSPENIFKKYRKLEKYIPQSIIHGTHGPVNIRQAPDVPTATSEKFVQAASETLTDYPIITDYNDPATPFGPFTKWQYYQKPDGSRESSSTAILKKLLIPNNNFEIIPSATVLRVLFTDKKATGVIYISKDQTQRVYATKGVILSAGTQTPLILQHSGIGPHDRLKKYNIPTISDLNVGENLYNHLILSTTFTKDPNDLPSPDVNALYSFGAFYPDPINPDISKPRGSEWIGIDSGETLTIALLQLQPYSKGYARIQSKDSLTTPLASEEALADPRDMEFFKALVRNQLVPVAAKLNENNELYNLIRPDPNLVGDDEYLEDYIRNNLDHAHHWQSQCLMAPRKKLGVVNSSGKVYGVKQLYVADNCIVPHTLDGNTAGIAYVIGYIVGDKINRKNCRKGK